MARPHDVSSMKAHISPQISHGVNPSAPSTASSRYAFHTHPESIASKAHVLLPAIAADHHRHLLRLLAHKTALLFQQDLELPSSVNNHNRRSLSIDLASAGSEYAQLLTKDSPSLTGKFVQASRFRASPHLNYRRRDKTSAAPQKPDQLCQEHTQDVVTWEIPR